MSSPEKHNETMTYLAKSPAEAVVAAITTEAVAQIEPAELPFGGYSKDAVTGAQISGNVTLTV